MNEQPSAISEEVIAAVCQLVNLELTRERVAELAPQVQEYFAGFAALDALDLMEEEPVVVFTAEWRNEDGAT